MKLSEAIRLGSMACHQIREAYQDASGGTCAIGAALKAIGRLSEANEYSNCYQDFPILATPFPEFPIDGFKAFDLWDAITELNDAHLWTRERIADWVESVEQQIEAPALQAVESR